MRNAQPIFVFFSSLIFAASACFAGDSGGSSAERASKTFQIVAQPTGWTGNSFVSGVAASLFLNGDNQLFAAYSVGQGFYVGSGSDHESLATKTFSAGFKHFSGNSFYYRIGLNSTQAEYHFSSDDSSGNLLLDRRLEGDYQSASFAVGNQWQWSGFTLGCDWVGVTQPFSSHLSKNDVTGPKAATSASNEDTRESLFIRAQLELVHLYLGASF